VPPASLPTSPGSLPRSLPPTLSLAPDPARRCPPFPSLLPARSASRPALRYPPRSLLAAARLIRRSPPRSSPPVRSSLPVPLARCARRCLHCLSMPPLAGGCRSVQSSLPRSLIFARSVRRCLYVPWPSVLSPLNAPLVALYVPAHLYPSPPLPALSCRSSLPALRIVDPLVSTHPFRSFPCLSPHVPLVLPPISPARTPCIDRGALTPCHGVRACCPPTHTSPLTDTSF
jgi:hypothetical protein